MSNAKSKVREQIIIQTTLLIFVCFLISIAIFSWITIGGEGKLKGFIINIGSNNSQVKFYAFIDENRKGASDTHILDFFNHQYVNTTDNEVWRHINNPTPGSLWNFDTSFDGEEAQHFHKFSSALVIENQSNVGGNLKVEFGDMIRNYILTDPIQNYFKNDIRFGFTYLLRYVAYIDYTNQILTPYASFNFGPISLPYKPFITIDTTASETDQYSEYLSKLNERKVLVNNINIGQNGTNTNTVIIFFEIKLDPFINTYEFDTTTGLWIEAMGSNAFKFQEFKIQKIYFVM